MVLRRTVWVAEFNDERKQFSTKKEAETAEQEFHQAQEIDKLLPVLHKYFHIRYAPDDKSCRYFYQCVDCGCKLVEWDAAWDGHRSEKGEVLSRIDYRVFLDGTRCLECDAKARQQLQKMVDFCNNNDDAPYKDVWIDDYEWVHSYNHKNEKLLRLLRIVNFWAEKSKKKS